MTIPAVVRRGFRKLAACCLVAAFCLGICFSTAAAADPPAVKGMGQALVAKVLHEGNLLSRPGVVGVGVSVNKNGQAVLTVMTEQAGVAGIPNQLQGVGVRVMVTGKIVAFYPGNGNGKGGPPGSGNNTPKVNPAGYFNRPVPIGVSIGTDTNAYCFAGTLGCRLRGFDGMGNVVGHYALSNNHVFAEENAGAINTDLILQPGTYDNGCIINIGNQVGTLLNFIPIVFDDSTNNYVDAAIATTSTDKIGYATPNGGYGIPSSVPKAASPNQLVEKFGRTTGDTKGVVDSIVATVRVGYDAGVAVFANQIVIVGTGKGKAATFSAAGDSGSLIVEQVSNQPVGLLFAGSSGGGPTSVTIANPIDTVLGALAGQIGVAELKVDDGSP